MGRGETSERGGRGASALDAAVDGGLALYARGDLDGALAEWRRVLALDPDSRRALAYVAYVEEHYALLARRFHAGPEAVRSDDPADGSEVLEFEAEPADEVEHDDDGYEAIELGLDDGGSDVRRPVRRDLKPTLLGGEVRWPDDPRSTLQGGELRAQGGLDDPRRTLQGGELRAFDGDPRRTLQGGELRKVAAPPVFTMDEVDAGWSLDEGWADLQKTLGVDPDLGEAAAALRGESGTGTGTGAGTGRRRPWSTRARPSSSGGREDETTAERSTFGGALRIRAESADFDLSELGLSSAPGSADALLDLGPLPSPEPLPAPPPVGRAARPSDPAREETRSGFAEQGSEITGPTGPARTPNAAGGGTVRGRPGDGGDDELTVDRRTVTWRTPDGRGRRADASETDGGPLAEEASAAGGTGPSALAVAIDGLDEETREPTGFFNRVSSPPSDRGAAAPDPRTDPGDRLSGAGSDPSARRRGAGSAPSRSALAPVDVDALRRGLLAELDAALPSSEQDEGIRQRITWLMDRARYESQRRTHALAAVAADLALAERPDSAVAQKLLHRNRDLLFEVYRDCLGDLAAIPVLAIPMAELAARSLDHRAAFLLSRIDGAMTFEDLLDIAGMPRLEAYRHLCGLLLLGVLSIR